MSETLLANTSTEGLAPLGTPAQRSFELVTGTVRADLGERHAALFAEPYPTKFGDRIDWYAAVDGRPRALEGLGEEERTAAEAVLETLVAEVRAKAEAYLGSKDPDEQRLGEALGNALVYPGPASVYVVGSGDDLQPVLVNWAWSADTQAAAKGGLSGVSKTRPAAPPAGAAAAGAAGASAGRMASAAPVAPPPERRAMNWWWLVWLGWLLLAAMIAAILYLMIEACALRLPGVTGFCPPPEPVASEAERRASVLRDRIAMVEKQIGIADRACQPAPPPAPVPAPPPQDDAAAPPPPPQPDAIDRRLRQAGAQKGDLTFSLIWDGPDDLDLHVTCPAGATINYRRRAACSGRLDVDGNAARPVQSPVENIFFQGPGAGGYKLRVHLYKTRSGGRPTPFRVRINDHGRVETLSGTVSTGGRSWTHTHRTGGR